MAHPPNEPPDWSAPPSPPRHASPGPVEPATESAVEPSESPAYEAPPKYDAPPPRYDAPPAYNAPPNYTSPPTYDVTPGYNLAPPYGPPTVAQPSYGQPPYGAPGAYPTGGYPPPPQPGFPADPSAWGMPPVEPPSRPSHLKRYWIVAACIAVGVIVIATVAAVSSANSPKAKVNVPAGPGVVFTDTAGHFAARFPETPDTRSIPESIDNVDATIEIASDDDSHELVESFRANGPFVQGDAQTVLHVIIGSAALTSNLTVSNESETTLQGHSARSANLAGAEDLQIMTVYYSSTRIYVLLAESGPGFDDLVASFVPIP